MLTLDNVYRASYALKNVVRKTDVIYAPKLCPDAQIYLKTENLQITGSFKVRGSYYKMSRLSNEERHAVSLPARQATMRRALRSRHRETESRRLSVCLTVPPSLR